MSSKSTDFLRVLGELRGGLVALDIAQKQEDVIRAIQNAGKKGTVTITLSYSPVGVSNSEVHVTAKVKAVAPADPTIEERSIFYAEHGQLHRNDPRQHQLYSGPKGVDAGVDKDEPAINRFG